MFRLLANLRLSCSLVYLAASLITIHSYASDPSLDLAMELVDKALKAEMDGDLLSRERYLKEASQLQSKLAPVNWFQGNLLNSDGEWQSIQGTIDSAKLNKLLAEYESMRSTQPPTVQGNLEAALWCSKNGLLQQCRAHLENILMFDHDNVVARQALGHKLVGNDWLSISDQFQLMEQAARFEAGYRNYHDFVKEQVSKLDDPNKNVRTKAIEKLQSINDPLATPIFESLVGSSPALSQLSVEWLGTVDHPQTSLALARVALRADSTDLRGLAIEFLKKRSFYDYVPQLLATMTSPLVYMSVPERLPNGAVGFRQTFSKEGMDRTQVVDITTAVQGSGGANYSAFRVGGGALNAKALDQLVGTRQHLRFFDPNLPIGTRNTTVDGVLEKRSIPEAQLSNLATLLAANAEMASRVVQANRENALIEKINTNISNLISEIASVEFTSVPRDVWQWWDRYNETEYQNSKYHRQQNYFNQYAVYPDHEYYFRDIVSFTRASCFVAGTKVQTLRGLREIEKILPGDMVLSRDVQTGELCYQPVICGTTRAPSKTVILTVDDETIHATTSHLLWACGKGWTKAGDLKPGDLLHTGSEPAVVIKSIPGGDLPTHNLVVADTHTYFVGSSRVLSHDVLPRGATRERIPGEFHLTRQ